VRGFTGDGSPATKAKLSSPAAVAVDSAGNLLIADDVNNRIRMVAERTGTFYGKKRIAGDIYRVAGGGSVSSEGDGFSGDGGPASHPRFSLRGGAVRHGPGRAR
jgi:hypothetical protein